MVLRELWRFTYDRQIGRVTYCHRCRVLRVTYAHHYLDPCFAVASLHHASPGMSPAYLSELHLKMSIVVEVAYHSFIENVFNNNN